MATHRKAGAMPARQFAGLVLGTVVAVNVLIVAALFATSGAGKNPVLTVAKFFGLYAALLLMLQVVLVSRLPWLDRRLGMDRLTRWHRWVGFTLLWTVLTHATLIVVGYARLSNMPLVDTFFSLAGVTAGLLGILAATTLTVVAAVSSRAVRRRLSYELWHGLHLLVYVVLVLALLHQYLEITTFAHTFAAAYWWGLWAFAVGALLVGRFALPIWRNAYHRFEVAAVVPESESVTSVYVTGRHLDRLPAEAGQFFIWRFPGHQSWWKANPFSLSAAPDGRHLRLSARAVGATSAGLRRVPVGTRVFAEGPYGAFTAGQRTRTDLLLIAGGIGITPIRALLEGATGDTVMLYRVREVADAVLLAELERLADARGIQLYLIAGRTGPEDAPDRPCGPNHLRSLVPDIAARDVFVCGPPAMTAAVLRSLRELGVPSQQVHAEQFSLV